MKCTIVIDPNKPEEVIVHVHKHTQLADEIRALCNQNDPYLIGYKDREACHLNIQDVLYFAVENNHVNAVTENDCFRVKSRLYELESRLPSAFVKIHQSCIANLKKVKCFSTSLAGSLQVIFVNGDTDFVSRRQVKHVKERLGL
ncbi:MAG: LytTR family transcriptional regulator DNA-binding domain-containing protein [Clostridia bacterium]|nr:LytTR family transcriptional regulator DNA-binding domain-containing protein [Clostridia bacterium]